MKKPLKIIQIDSRGQIVIPKEVRTQLQIEDGTGFFIYPLDSNNLLFKKIPTATLSSKDVAKIKRGGDK